MAPSKSELIDSAQRYAQKGQLDRAIKDYQQALQIDAGDIQTRLRLGDVFAKKGATRDAIEQYFRVAERHTVDGFYLKAIAVHKQILKLEPTYIDSSARLADLYHKQGLLSDALTAYQQVAAVYDKKGAVREALDTLTKMADLDPQNVAIRVKLGELYLKASIKESGIDQLLKAAELYGQGGKPGEQAKILDKIAALGALSPAATRSVITAMIAGGQADGALQRLASLLARSPDDPELRELEAEACLKVGQTERAAAALAAAIGSSPQRLGARRRLVELRLDAGDDDGAVAAAEGFTPGSVPPGRLDAAVQAVSAILARDPAPPQAVQATLYRRLADLHGARNDAPGREAALAVLSGHAPALEKTAELTIEVDDGDPSGGSPLGDASPLEGAAVPTLDGDLGLSLDFDAGPDTAPLDTRTVDGGSFDETPLDTRTVDAPGRGDEAPLEGAAAAARARILGSPEARVLAAGDVELALDQIPEELDEAEFFVQQGLLDAARAIYKRILAVDREHPVAVERLARLEGGGKKQEGADSALPRPSALPGAPSQSPARLEAGGPPSSSPARALPAAPPSSSPAGMEHGPYESFDLAAVMAGASGGSAAALLGDPEERVSFQEVFREFKKGVERQVGDDPETHYNLGIAYKEMGLIEDAIAEFERALADPRRASDCYTMIGLARLERGETEAAIEAYKNGLEHTRGNRQQVAALAYELGLAFEAAGRTEDARAAFAAVASAYPAFRDVGKRLAALGGAPASGPNGTFEPQSLLEEEPSSALPGGPSPSPARAEAGAPPSSSPPRSKPGAPRRSSQARPQTGGKPGARDRISFV